MKYNNVVFDEKYGYWEYEFGKLIPFNLNNLSDLLSRNHEVNFRATTESEHQEIYDVMNGNFRW